MISSLPEMQNENKKGTCVERVENVISNVKAKKHFMISCVTSLHVDVITSLN